MYLCVSTTLLSISSLHLNSLMCGQCNPLQDGSCIFLSKLHYSMIALLLSDTADYPKFILCILCPGHCTLHAPQDSLVSLGLLETTDWAFRSGFVIASRFFSKQRFFVLFVF